MAMHDENHFFTRRIADRGSDETVFYSQDRKIQETDPKDVIWDGIIEKEEHPKDGDGYKFQETNSEAFIRDENFGKEEYLWNCSTFHQAPPVFDEYGDDEWYYWMTGVGVTCDMMLVASVIEAQHKKIDIFNITIEDKISAFKKITWNDPIESVSFDKTKVLVVMADGVFTRVIYLCDVEETHVGCTLNEHRSHCTSLEFLTLGYVDTNLKMWDFGKKVCIQEHKRPVGEVFLIWKSISYFKLHDLSLSFGIEFHGWHLSSNAILYLNLQNSYVSDFLAYLVLIALIAIIFSNFTRVGNNIFATEVCVAMNENLVDVPFDPGGCGYKSKLEDEFFRRGRE